MSQIKVNIIFSTPSVADLMGYTAFSISHATNKGEYNFQYIIEKLAGKLKPNIWLDIMLYII